MGYFEEGEIPFQYALANAFTLCDAYHCAMHTGTDANRLFHLERHQRRRAARAGAVSVNTWENGFTWTRRTARLLSTPATPGRLTPSASKKPGSAGSATRTCPMNWGDNLLAGFQQYRAANMASGNITECYERRRPQPAYAGTGQRFPAGLRRGHRRRGQPLYKGMANTMPARAACLAAFKRDVGDRQAPQVSWIVAPADLFRAPRPIEPGPGRRGASSRSARCADRLASRCGARPCCW